MRYLAKHTETGHYLAGIDENDAPIFTETYNDAMWSHSQTRLQKYVNDNSIETAEVEGSNGGTNPPQRPPY